MRGAADRLLVPLLVLIGLGLAGCPSRPVVKRPLPDPAPKPVRIEPKPTRTGGGSREVLGRRPTFRQPLRSPFLLRARPTLAGRRQGVLDRADLLRGLRPLRARLNRCLGRHLARLPGLARRLVITFVVGPYGRVWEVDADGEALVGPRTRRCVVGAVRSLAFSSPDPAGFVLIRRPVELGARGAARK